jgi:hypothetical protein
VAYVAEGMPGRLLDYAPLFVLQTRQEKYNLIGRPSARFAEDGKEEIYVNAARPAVYAEEQQFEAERGRYTNLIYRVHFERTPFPHLTAGRNVGLFCIITLNEREEPVLVVTVHTCGCYLAVCPTTYLPEAALPVKWHTGLQEVHGEVLPAMLRYPDRFDPGYRPVIAVRDDVHRIMDVRVESLDEVPWRYDVVPMELLPIAALDALPLGDGVTSFFETEGKRKGFVKGAYKPLERVLMSWAALDLRVGEDKRLADSEEMNTVFYTVLKPWDQEKADLSRFADCLRYFGWRL